MRLSRRSYPHPVVGNQDDVPRAAFQSSVEFSMDKDNLYIDVSAKCSSTTVMGMIDARKACYVLHVECGYTLFRKSWLFESGNFRHAVSLNDLCGTIEVNIAVCATQSITDYTMDGAHPDYENALFQIVPGDFLAIGDTLLQDIVPNYETLGKIGSIMEIHASTKDGDQPVEYLLGEEKIQIVLSQRDFAEYGQAKANPEMLGLLMCSVVVPVLMEAIRQIQPASDEQDNDESFRWKRILRARIDGLGEQAISREPFLLAQQLLELPVKRALASAVKILENAS